MMSRILYPILLGLATAGSYVRSATTRTQIQSHHSVNVSLFSGPSSTRAGQSLFLVCDGVTYEYPLGYINGPLHPFDPQMLISYCSQKTMPSIHPGSVAQGGSQMPRSQTSIVVPVAVLPPSSTHASVHPGSAVIPVVPNTPTGSTHASVHHGSVVIPVVPNTPAGSTHASVHPGLLVIPVVPNTPAGTTHASVHPGSLVIPVVPNTPAGTTHASVYVQSGGVVPSTNLPAGTNSGLPATYTKITSNQQSGAHTSTHATAGVIPATVIPSNVIHTSTGASSVAGVVPASAGSNHASVPPKSNTSAGFVPATPAAPSSSKPMTLEAVKPTETKEGKLVKVNIRHHDRNGLVTHGEATVLLKRD